LISAEMSGTSTVRKANVSRRKLSTTTIPITRKSLSLIFVARSM